MGRAYDMRAAARRRAVRALRRVGRLVGIASRVVLLVAPLAVLSGCAAGEVRGRFAAIESCPTDRITVTQIGTVPPRPIPPPPSAIASDAARAAVYYQTRREADTSAGHRVFIAEGCGARHRYVCDYSDADSSWCEPAD